MMLVVSACSGTPVNRGFERDFDFSSLKAFAWGPNADAHQGMAASNQLVDRRIRSAIGTTLTARQFRELERRCSGGRVEI